jgi:hypothetical protein
LDTDTKAEIRLRSAVGKVALDATLEHRPARPGAVGGLSLTVPCRPDLVDRVIAMIERGRPSRLSALPSPEVELDLLRSLKRVTLGDVALVGPDGERVTHVSYTDKYGVPRKVLRLTQHGRWVVDAATVAELRGHVDLAVLVEEPDPA